MHYYGVYALARAAGLKDEIAERIADASQFVDDYIEDDDIETSDGALISYWPSGHGMVCDATLNLASLQNADPHRVWVPFHFLPGNEGESYTERMRCVKDSAIAQAAMQRVLARSKDLFAPELLGVMAHIYADTFSHYGFSGLRNDSNLVDPHDIEIDVKDSNVREHILGKAIKFFDVLSGAVAGNATRGLGHASVADYPDRPYLKWKFTYQDGSSSGWRDNRVTYIEACEKLFKLFCDFRAEEPSRYGDGSVEQGFETIRGIASGIIDFEGVADDRNKKWRDAASAGEFGAAFEIPLYDDHQVSRELHDAKDLSMDEGRSVRIWRFTYAVEFIRNMILVDLLPGCGLIG